MSDERSDTNGSSRPPRATNGAVPDDLRHRIPLRELADSSDDPIDLVAMQADDELVSALAAGMTVSAPGVGGYDPDDRVAAMLAAWKSEVDEEPIPELLDIETATAAVTGRRPVRRPGRRARHLVPLSAAAGLVVFAIAGMSVGAQDARPGDTLWPVTRVLYQDYAKSAEALVVVEQAQEKAIAALAVGDKETAAAAVSQARAAASDVRAEDGQGAVVEELSRLEGEVEQTTPGVPNQQVLEPPPPAASSSPSPSPSSEPTEDPTGSPTATPSGTGEPPAEPTQGTEPPPDVRSLNAPPSDEPGPGPSPSPSAPPATGEPTDPPPDTPPPADDEGTPEPTGTAAEGAADPDSPQPQPSPMSTTTVEPGATASGDEEDGDAGETGGGEPGEADDGDGVSGASSTGSGTATIPGPTSPSPTATSETLSVVPPPASETLPVVPSPSATVESSGEAPTPTVTVEIGETPTPTPEEGS